jgi:hypothetical protein
MSFFEKCRQTTVIVEDGSGVLFQPMTESYSYILTAKHNLYNDIDFGSYLYPKDLKDLNIVFYDGTVLNNELEEDVLAKFEHQSLDIAILKIKKRDFITSFRNNKNINNSDEFKFYGFSGYKRTYLNFVDRISHFTLIVGDQIILNKEIIVRNSESFTQEDILGCSGGGVFKEFNDDFLLIGIECRMDACSTSERNNRRLRFITIDAFDEIIANNSSELEPLYPPYMGSFDLLVENIFLLNEYEEKRDFVRNRLKYLARTYSNELIPIAIKQEFEDELLINGFDINNITDNELWQMYLEFVLLSLIIENKENITIDKIKEIYKKRKILFAKADRWIELKEDILKSNLLGLQKNGTVFIACNGNRRPNKVDLCNSIINISQPPQLEEMRIDQGMDYSVDLKYKHIYAIEKLLLDNEDKFASATGTNIDEILKEVLQDVCM